MQILVIGEFDKFGACSRVESFRPSSDSAVRQRRRVDQRPASESVEALELMGPAYDQALPTRVGGGCAGAAAWSSRPGDVGGREPVGLDSRSGEAGVHADISTAAVPAAETFNEVTRMAEQERQVQPCVGLPQDRTFV